LAFCWDIVIKSLNSLRKFYTFISFQICFFCEQVTTYMSTQKICHFIIRSFFPFHFCLNFTVFVEYFYIIFIHSYNVTSFIYKFSFFCIYHHCQIRKISELKGKGLSLIISSHAFFSISKYLISMFVSYYIKSE
jgi:hypothetical protein